MPAIFVDTSGIAPDGCSFVLVGTPYEGETFIVAGFYDTYEEAFKRATEMAEAGGGAYITSLEAYVCRDWSKDSRPLIENE